MNLQILCLILALICFALDFISVPVPRVKLISLGLFLFTLSFVISGSIKTP